MSNGKWQGSMVEHSENGTTRLSIPFTWNLPEAYQRAVWLGAMGQRVIAGGPAVNLMPDYLADVAEVGTTWPDALQSPGFPGARQLCRSQLDRQGVDSVHAVLVQPALVQACTIR